MTKRLLVAVVTVVTIASLAPAAGGQITEPDWVLIKFTAGPEGAEGLRWSGVGIMSSRGSDVRTKGAGVGAPGFSFVPVFGIDGGPTKVSTTSDLGSVDMTVTESGPDEGGIVIATFVRALGPGESAGQLFFTTGAVVSDFNVEHEVAEGSVTVTASSGTGSGALVSVDPNDGGVAVQAGMSAAGTSAHSVTTSSGIAGGFSGFECGDFCRSTWSSPDGRSGFVDWYAVYVERTGFGQWLSPQGFGGPAGDWDWTWTGAMRPRVLDTQEGKVPLYGAWAPVGDDWTLFKG